MPGMATATGDSEVLVDEQESGKEADQQLEQDSGKEAGQQPERDSGKEAGQQPEQDSGKEADQQPEQDCGKEAVRGSEIEEPVEGHPEVVTEAKEQSGDIEEQEQEREQVQGQVGEIEEHGNGIQEQRIEEQEKVEGQLGKIEEQVTGEQVHVEVQAHVSEIVEEKGRELEVSVGVGPGRDGTGEPASGPATPSGKGTGPAPGTPPVRTRIMDIRSSAVPGEDDQHSRQRMLSFAARRYSRAVAANADDFDAMYNWALVLQETADNTPLDGGPPGKDVLLEDACSKYEAAISICPSLHEAYYNWAIAISDRAKIRGRTKEAEELWKQACEKYERSLQLNWNSPQALNNWGLALQELGAIVPLKEKRGIIRSAIRKFRAAIGLRFDFHRAVYNLGTVLYGLAEDTLRSGRKVSRPDHMPSELYSQSAIYIAAAHSLKPDYPVYRSALRLVRSMLPLPYLKAGYLLVHPGDDSLAPHNDWKRLWFVIDHEAFYEMDKPEEKLAKNFSRRITNPGGSEPSSPSMAKTPVKISSFRMELEDIVYMTPSADLSLPVGGGFRIDTSTRQQYFVADSWELMEGWLDAIRLAYTITVRGKSEILAGVLTG